MRGIFITYLIFINFSLGLCQEDYQFQLKEIIDLPDSEISEVKLGDLNNDSILDYTVSDDDSIYLIDGQDLSRIASFRKPNRFSYFNIGDINNDQLMDLAIDGVHQAPNDSIYISFYLGPDYTQEIRLSIYAYQHGCIESLNNLFFNRLFNKNIIAIGTRYDYYWYNGPENGEIYSGELYFYEFSDGEFAFIDITSYYGPDRVYQIFTYNHNNSSLILFRSYLYDLSPWWDKTVYSIHYSDSTFYTRRIWYEYPADYFGIGFISKITKTNSSFGNNDLIYFFNCNDIWSHLNFYLTCLEYPFEEPVWQNTFPFSYDFFSTYYDNLGFSQNRLFALSDSIYVFNPETGAIISHCPISGYQGDFYGVDDQEGDGIDEFFFTDTNRLYVYNLDLLTSINDITSANPNGFKLFENYPNPFNAQTVICYSLPRLTDVTINIYDILGKKIETLVSNKQPVGKYQVIWNAENLSSGVYFYKIQAGNFEQSKKMILLK